MPAAVRLVMGGVIGALVGAAMYKFVGCRTGACPLTGNLYVAMFLWGFVGLILAYGK